MVSRVVIDTNVVFAAASSRQGASFRLFTLIGRGLFTVELSVPLCFEYEDVLARVKKLDPEKKDAILNQLVADSEWQEIFYLWRPVLPNSKDDLLLELAVRSRASAILTYNKRHFLAVAEFGIRALTPLEFLREIGVLP